jgi:exopolysaccharide biosynthesis WecB/TagA/CpsF family protein
VQILGIDFFEGTVAKAVDRALERRGLVVAPSGTCFTRLKRDEVYRNAMTRADLVLPDSGFMVLLWRFLRHRRLTRISGLAYLKELLGRAEFRRERSILWVLPNEEAQAKTLRWLQAREFASTSDDCYIAPIYGGGVTDPVLLDRVRSSRPGHVVIALSGGVQEKLGFYLRENCADRPAIHCIGAALGFVTGYQAAIPNWADRLYLGWLIRLISNPRKFLPRATSALALPGLIRRYGEKLPAPEKLKAETLKG